MGGHPGAVRRHWVQQHAGLERECKPLDLGTFRTWPLNDNHGSSAGPSLESTGHSPRTLEAEAQTSEHHRTDPTASPCEGANT